ncbi:hypothetical protein AB0J90_04685 [Micromonospora sp. NPDC049523]|uniref:hypothetical protein n=1 Tax=Micromonospora sp. NPDC049523 TaxID=3155921 RepID=UPI0034266ACB
MTFGWSPYPGAYRAPENLPRVEPGRVVGLGALCDLQASATDDVNSQSFLVSEFATLEDGRRVLLHAERGYSIAARSTGAPGNGAIPLHETREDVTRCVLNTVLPDDDGCGEAHPWAWLAELARARGLEVTAEDLKNLPYEVALTDEVTRWLAST